LKDHVKEEILIYGPWNKKLDQFIEELLEKSKDLKDATIGLVTETGKSVNNGEKRLYIKGWKYMTQEQQQEAENKRIEEEFKKFLGTDRNTHKRRLEDRKLDEILADKWAEKEESNV